MGDKKYEAVISGVSGRFPECESVEELKQKLFNKINLVTVDNVKWIAGELDVPPQLGKMKDIFYFDTTFFGIHTKLCKSLDSLTRQNMERSFEAIFDSGMNPVELHGTNTAVFMASMTSESEFITLFDHKKESFGILGHNRTMQANRISYNLHLTGPSFSIDSTWTGGMQALQMAQRMIEDGHANAALVGTCSLLQHSNLSLQYFGMGKLNSDGCTKSFSADADGYSRAEACVVFFLQRAEDARRSYGTLLHTKILNFGERSGGFVQCSRPSIHELLQNAYEESGVDPHSLAYLEADGSASKKADASELNAVADVFCHKRMEPLLVGSVKSNLGHTEAAASMVAMVKALITLDSGIIPPNLHYSQPNPDVPALASGHLQVVTEPTPLPGDTVGVTTFGLAGTYGHVIIRQNKKIKKKLSEDDVNSSVNDFPLLVTASGRNEAGMKLILHKIENMPVDKEFISLLHHVFCKDIQGHLFRAFTILPNTDVADRKIQQVTGEKRPVWFIFSGMGSQWAGMGKYLLRVPIFAAAVNKCQTALASAGVDVKHIITNPDPKSFDNILNSFVGIAAIQIGLVDILHAMGIKPDGIVGHSVGELGCAYADGCFTAEQMILAAYARGRASIETKLIKGKMAAIGKGYRQIKDELPESIEVACHNSADSCTLSGPDEDMEKYIVKLQQKGIFAKLVNVSNIAYHSRYIAPAAPALLSYLKEVIPKPLPRSSRWVSSSVPEKDWNKPLAATSSAEYHTNNLLSPVLFEEATRKIPHNAITIEIAPHGLLQAILRRSLTAGCTNVALTQRENKHGLRYLLAAVGKLYLAGLTPDLRKLYPTIEFPVSRGTPALHPLIVWEHSEEWPVAKLSSVLGDNLGERLLTICLTDDKYQIYKSHKLYGRFILPPAALVVFAWESLSNLRKETGFKVPIVFENVQFFSPVEVPDKSKVKLYTLLRRGTGEWEMCVDQTIVASGRINILKEDKSKEYILESLPKCDGDADSGVEYTEQDVYSLLDSLGYTHGDIFKGIRWLSVNDNKITAKVHWQGNWMLCLDNLLKVALFSQMDDNNELYIPMKIRRLFIDPNKIVSNKNVSDVDVTYDIVTGVLSSPTLGLVMSDVSHHTPTIEQFHTSALRVEERQFVPFTNQMIKEVNQLLNISIQLVLENLSLSKDGKTHMTVTELQNGSDSFMLLPQVEAILNRHPDIEPKIMFGAADTIYSNPDEDPTVAKEIKENYLVIVTHSDSFRDALSLIEINPRAFLLLHVAADCTIPTDLNLSAIVEQHFGNTKIALLKRGADVHARTNYIVHTDTDMWMIELTENVKALDNKLSKSRGDGVVYLVTKGEPYSGVNAFVRNTDLAFGVSFIRYVFILHDNAPTFSPTSSFYAKHLSQDLKVNIVKDSMWGTYRHFLIMDHSISIQEPKVTQLSKFSLGDVNVKYLGFNVCGLNINSDVDDKCKLSHVEYSGTTKSGNRVMGLVEYQPAYDLVTPDSVFTWTIPHDWTLDTAATVPLSYILAYHGLVLKAELQKSESVLIIGGHSTVGQAAVAIALSVGSTVYVSYAKEEQQKHLIKEFPQLHESQMFCSEEKSFELEMLMHTKGRGFNVIFNCLGENKFRASAKCLQEFGRYLQLGYIDKDNCGRLGSVIFLKFTSVFGCYAENLLTLPVETKKQLRDLVTKGINNGTVKPLKRKVLSGSYNGVEALKLLCKEACISDDVKVLISLDGKKENTISSAHRKYFCDPDKLYVIFGGNNGLWVEFTEWLIKRGARKVMVTLNRLSMSSHTARRLNVLMQNYACATINVVPVSQFGTEEAASILLSKAIKVGPLAAIFFITVDEDSRIVYSMDRASRCLLDPVSVQFVCILSGGADVCEQRRRDRLPALALLWDKPYFIPAKVLPILDHILTEDSYKSPVVLLTEFNLMPPELDMSPVHLQWQLPEGLSQLIEFGEHASGNKPCFTEVVTRSPRYKYTKDISPVFLIPGLKSGQFDSLIKRLVYPAFEASLPQNVESIQQAANLLLQVIKKDFKNLGVFTLVASSWGGGLALTLAHQLEAEGKHTTVILFDGAPETVQTWINSVSSDLDFSIFMHYFTITNQIRAQLTSISEWNEKLDLLTVGVDNADKIKIGLTTLRNRMQAILNLTPPAAEDKVNGQTYLYRPKGVHESDNCSLQEYCKKSITIYVSEESDFQQMLDAELTSRYINSLNMFEYQDAMVVHDVIRPYETDIHTFIDNVVF